MKVDNMIPVNLNRPSIGRGRMGAMEEFLKDTCATGKCIKTDTFQVDVLEDGDFYVIKADLPGAKKEEIELDLEGNHLSIHVEKPRADDSVKFIHKERRHANMSRSLVLGDASMDEAQAHLEDGVLIIRAPKRIVAAE